MGVSVRFNSLGEEDKVYSFVLRKGAFKAIKHIDYKQRMLSYQLTS